MRTYQMYVCEKCKKESSSRDEIRLCEAKHYGLETLEEFNEYASLVEKFNKVSRALSGAQNPQLLENQDEALKVLMEFEKNHNMMLWK